MLTFTKNLGTVNFSVWILVIASASWSFCSSVRGQLCSTVYIGILTVEVWRALFYF